MKNKILNTFFVFLFAFCFNITESNARGGDGTGPCGMGPKTGRGLGPCKNNNDKQLTIPNSGQGLGPNHTNRKLNGTGPQGKGPRTGRGLGPCNN
jgi:hypothetical protein